MQNILAEIARLTIEAGTEPTETGLPGVVMIRGEVPEHQLAAVYEPMIGLVVQGAKTISIGTDVVLLKAPSYFVIPARVPATGRVHQGPRGLPYVSLGLNLTRPPLLDLLKDLSNDSRDDSAAIETFSACTPTADFLDAWLRLLRLTKTPEHIPGLAPAYEREILYRVLTGPQGWRLRQHCLAEGGGTNLHRALEWIHGHYAEALEIKRLAARAGMAVTTFHRRFKQITGLSPLQFQKRLRLLEARRLLVLGGIPVTHVAVEVGYESASQFTREYARFFGASPARDASRLRAEIQGGDSRT